MALDRTAWGWWLLCLLLKQLPQETRHLLGAQPVGTAQPFLLLGLLRVLVLSDMWLPKAALAHRPCLTGWVRGQAGLLAENMSVSLVWTVLLIQMVPREDLCPLGRESSMSDLGQLGSPEFRVGKHVRCHSMDPLSVRLLL